MKSFRIKTIILSLVIFICGYGASVYLINKNLFTSILFAVGSFAALFQLIKLTDRTNRELAKFLLSVKYADFTVSFSEKGYGKSFVQLAEAFNKLIESFRKTRTEKEEQAFFFQTALSHIDAGLICFDHSGGVEFINRSACRLFGVVGLKNAAELAKHDKELAAILTGLKSGTKQLYKFHTENDNKNLVIYASDFRMRGKTFKLVSLQNIQSELEEAEAEAWQKLIRVLTHEIMNTVAPISSLASTVNVMLEDNDGSLSDNDMKDVTKAVSTIERRSRGLIHFIENYRSLATIPKPSFEIVRVSQLFDRIATLMAKDISNNQISLGYKVEPYSLEVTADPSLIDQILINLVKNSIHALKGRADKSITLEAALNEQGRVTIILQDNGSGIPDDISEKIFVPFFTTNPEGSGIGLSLARQIMRLHGGSIRAVPGLTSGAKIILLF